MASGGRRSRGLWLAPVLGLVAIGVLVAGYAVVVGSHQPPATPSFLGITVSEINSLTFTAKGKSLTLYQVPDASAGGTSWNLSSPTGGPADQSLTQSFASALVTLQPSRTLTKAPTATQLKEYGLDPATASVEVGLTGGKSPVTLDVGIASPVGGHYAQIAGQAPVYMVSGSVPNDISADPTAWLPPPSTSGTSGTPSGTASSSSSSSGASGTSTGASTSSSSATGTTSSSSSAG